MIDNFVTGASGFIGKHLMARLTASAARTETVAIEHDEIESCAGECKNFFFLSTYGNMPEHEKQYGPWAMLSANVEQVAHSLRNVEYEHFLFVSSSSVTLPVQTPYSRTKRAAEEMILAMPIPGCIVRPYSVVGVNEQKEHLIPTLIRSCLEGEPMNFVPSPSHDFIDVSDVVDAMLLLADQKATGIFELGRGIRYSNLEVLDMVEKACGRKANVTTVDRLRDYDNADWVCRDSKILSLGWKPTKTLDTSIHEMVTAYGNELRSDHDGVGDKSEHLSYP